MMHVAQFKTFVSFGFILSAALSNGRIAQKFKLPAITGFLITGLIAGPSMLGVLNAEQVTSLQAIDHIALSFIALVAGSELRLSALRSQLYSILSVMFGLTLATFTLTAFSTYLLSSWIPALSDLSSQQALSAAILLGVIMVARSPSAAIAMINELKAKGSFTQLILGVTVLMDVVVITLFAAGLSVAHSLSAGQALSVGFIKEICIELVSSGFIAWLLYLAIRGLLNARLSSALSPILMVCLSTSVYYLAHLGEQIPFINLTLHFDPLLTCLLAGVLMSNHEAISPECSERFETQVSSLSPWIYLAFFTITGASLKLDLLTQVWPLALLFFTIRLVGLAIGSTLGGAIAGEPKQQHAFRWMGFVTQAGVGLGLAKRVATEFPSWGPSLATLMIAVIVMNELMGPLFFKKAIISSGESHTTES